MAHRSLCSQLHLSSPKNRFQLGNSSSFVQRCNIASKVGSLQRPLGLCFLGAPGVGKGTYSKRIASHFNAKVICSGDLIRELASIEQKQGSKLGATLQDCINNGHLVSDDIVINLVSKHINNILLSKSQDSQSKSFILDGFPRTVNQAEKFEYKLDCVMYFKLPDNVLIGKMVGRRICNNCGNNFNITDINQGDIVMPSMKPKIDGICDDCGCKLSIRPDDNKETIEKRLKIYHKETNPIEMFYKNKGLLLEYHIKKGIDDVPDMIQSIENFMTRQAKL